MTRRRPAKEILQKAKTIKGKRSRVVVEHLLKHGSITTEDLKNYGYEHPPRAIKDVRDQGLPLERFWTKSSDGVRIAGYRFADQSRIRHDRLGGRKVFSREFRMQVINGNDSKCAVCNTRFEERYFQIDHRIPYEIASDPDQDDRSVADYMALCGSCNRAKSWSCEHCPNWLKQKDPRVCTRCYWANPIDYAHIGTEDVRRLALLWRDTEVSDYEALSEQAGKEKLDLPDFVKNLLRVQLK